MRVLDTFTDILIIIFIAMLSLYIFSQPVPLTYKTSYTKISSSPTEVPFSEPEQVTYVEQDAYELYSRINEQRISNGLPALIWDGAVAKVAEDYAQELAKANAPLTPKNKLCAVPFLAHRDVKNRYQDERLRDAGIRYFSSSSENLFLISKWETREAEVEEDFECLSFAWDESTNFSEELSKRIDYLETVPDVTWNVEYTEDSRLLDKIVTGWMESEPHRKNILNGKFTHTGVGIAEVNDFVFAVQIFIKKENCGYDFGPCCEGLCFEGLSCIEGMCR